MPKSLRAFIGAFVFAFLAQAAFADAPDLSGANRQWLEDRTQHCWAYVDEPQFKAEVTWDGACKDQLADGQGTFTVAAWGKPVVTINGLFSGGKLNGAGDISYADGRLLSGTFLDGKLEGTGRRKSACGGTYDGTFHLGLPDGQGTFLFCNSDGSYNGSYKGGVRAGLYHGQGLWVQRNSDSFEGEFTDNEMTGVMTYRRAADGVVLTGKVVIPHNDPAFPILPTQYPDVALRTEEEGRVWVQFTVTKDGHTKDISLDQSSGHDDLDAAALAAAPTWRMTPASVGGQPIDFLVRRAVTFKIAD